MNGQHELFKPEPIRWVKPSESIRARLAQLRAEFAAKAEAQIKAAPHVFLPHRVA